MSWPKSLTAVVHVKLSYDDDDEEETRPGEDEVAPMDRLRDSVSRLDPYLRDLVIRFAEEIRDESFSEKEEGRQSPD
jgi:hypothetical protein